MYTLKIADRNLKRLFAVAMLGLCAAVASAAPRFDIKLKCLGRGKTDKTRYHCDYKGDLSASLAKGETAEGTVEVFYLMRDPSPDASSSKSQMFAIIARDEIGSFTFDSSAPNKMALAFSSPSFDNSVRKVAAVVRVISDGKVVATISEPNNKKWEMAASKIPVGDDVLGEAIPTVSASESAPSTESLSLCYRIDDKGNLVIDGGKPDSWQAGPTEDWYVNWDNALAAAKKTGKKLFVLKTISNCPCEEKLKRNVLDTRRFNDFAKENLVLLYLDMPHYPPLCKEQEMHNEQIVKALDIHGGVPTVGIFSTDGKMLCQISGGVHVLGHYLDKLRDALAQKGDPVYSRNGKMLFANGGYEGLKAKIDAERVKLPPASKEDFKARLTGVAVCDRQNRNFEDFEDLEFSPPTTHLEVPKDKMAVFRVEYDFPQGYAATVSVRSWDLRFSHSPERCRGKGVQYGFLGIDHSLQKGGGGIKLDFIDIKTNCDPEFLEYPHGWTICSPKVDLRFKY